MGSYVRCRNYPVERTLRPVADVSKNNGSKRLVIVARRVERQLATSHPLIYVLKDIKREIYRRLCAEGRFENRRTYFCPYFYGPALRIQFAITLLFMPDVICVRGGGSGAAGARYFITTTRTRTTLTDELNRFPREIRINANPSLIRLCEAYITCRLLPGHD